MPFDASPANSKASLSASESAYPLHSSSDSWPITRRMFIALLEQGELFAQEEVLGSQCAARPGNEHEETNEIAGDEGQRGEPCASSWMMEPGMNAQLTKTPREAAGVYVSHNDSITYEGNTLFDVAKNARFLR